MRFIAGAAQVLHNVDLILQHVVMLQKQVANEQTTVRAVANKNQSSLAMSNAF